MKNILHNILTWQWTKTLVYWLVVSAGTIAELCFLIASLWMVLNKNVHSFFLMFMSEAQTIHATELATMSYVGLPEIILSLAIVITIGHFRVYRHQKDMIALVWSILYGIPTIVFLVLSVITLGCSVQNVGFELPVALVITRAIAGYMFGLVALLYHYIGKEQEADRLAEKDGLIIEMSGKIDALHQQYEGEKRSLLAQIEEERHGFNSEIALLREKFEDEKESLVTRLESKISILESENDTLRNDISTSKKRETELLEAVQESDDAALQAYPQETIDWLKSGIKTANVEDIARNCGFQKRKIENAITRGELKTYHKDKRLVLVSSLVPWLKNQKTTTVRTDEIPALHIVNG